MNVLVTGARAPISVDIIRALCSQGHRVWACDSREHPVGRWTPGLEGYVRLPPPAQAFEAFNKELVALCTTHEIELVIPTSEEVFWLSRVRGLPKACEGFWAPSAVLEQLHHKGKFAKLANELGFGPGACHELTSLTEAQAFLEKARETPTRWVFKQVYSRFATRVLVNQPASEALRLGFEPGNPWLAQPHVPGHEVCVYNVAREGEVVMHCAYVPRWRAGAGAGVYFEPVQDARLLALSQAVAQCTSFTGQLSFDVMVSPTGAVTALECNPRGTSGVHLAVQHPQALARSFTEKIHPPVPYRTDMAASRALRLPLLLYHPKLLLTPEGWRTVSQAKDALALAGVGLWPQIRATLELALCAHRLRLPMLAASTHDIEFNGGQP